jgi:hypothetical protein
MKKLLEKALIGMIFLTATSYGFWGCNDDKQEVIPPLNTPEQYIEVGKLHNQGLEFIFQELKAQSITSTRSGGVQKLAVREDPHEFIKQATLKFCEQEKSLSKRATTCKQVLEHTTSSLTRATGSVDPGTDYSPALQRLLDEMNEVLHQSFQKEELSQLKALLDGINNKAAETLSETEAAALYCATSTGYSSYQYWMENHKKWYFALHYPEILEKYNDTELNKLRVKNGVVVAATRGWWDDLWNTAEDWWKSVSDSFSNWWNNGGSDIVREDAKGALEGALEGVRIAAISGGSFSAAIPAGAVTGAVVHSAAEIITIWIWP